MNASLMETQGAGQTVTYRYDMLGRIVAIGSATDDAQYAEYTYTTAGDVRQEMLNPRRAPMPCASTFDPLGHTVSLSNPFFTEQLSFRRDGTGEYMDGNVTQQSFDFKANQFPPGAAPRSHLYDYAYDPFGQLTSATAWDAALRMPVPEWSFGSATHDADGSLLSAQSSARSLRFDRDDDSHRVRRIVNTAGNKVLHEYAYDAAGAVTADPAGGIASISYEATSGLTASVRTTRGEAVAYLQSGSLGVALRTTTKAQATTQTLCLGSGSQDAVNMEIAAGGSGPSSERILIRGPLGLVSILIDGAATFVVRDQRGSTRVLADADGAAVGWFNYLPYGETMPGNSVNTPMAAQTRERFNGGEWEESTGLYVLPARLFSPDAGLFLQTDPAEDTPDVYAYCGNDPINYVDPSGEISWRANWARYLGREVVTTVPRTMPEYRVHMVRAKMHGRVDSRRRLTRWIPDARTGTAEESAARAAVLQKRGYTTKVRRTGGTVIRGTRQFIQRGLPGVPWSAKSGAEWWKGMTYLGWWASPYGLMAGLRIVKAVVMGVESGLTTEWAFKKAGVSKKKRRAAGIVMGFASAINQIVSDAVFSYRTIPWAIAKAGGPTAAPGAKWRWAVLGGIFVAYSVGTAATGAVKAAMFYNMVDDKNYKKGGALILGIGLGMLASLAYLIVAGTVSYGWRAWFKIDQTIPRMSADLANPESAWREDIFGKKFVSRALADSLWGGSKTLFDMVIFPSIVNAIAKRN